MQLKEGTYIFDIECDGLTPTKIHCIALETSEGSFEITDYEEMKQCLLSAKVLIGHNIIRFDIPVLEKLLDIKIESRLIDTLALSWTLFPDRSSHGLEGWGDSFGINKPEVDDWESLDIEVYMDRCREDVRINTKLWGYIVKKLSRLYTDEQDLNSYIDYLSFKMHCAMLQEQNGWKLDEEYARSALSVLVEEQEEKVRLLASVMPKVAVYRSIAKPKVMFRKDGSLSKLGEDWLVRLAEQDLDAETQEITVCTGFDDPNPNSNSQIKDWLFILGWKPDTFKQNAKGEEVPQINKEPQKGGGVTDSVRKLFEIEPKLEVLDGLSVLNSRIPLLRSFLGSSDYRRTGKLKAGVAGFTNTLRFRHAGLVNLPRVDRAYSEPIRGSLVADDGFVLAGSDMTNVEDRTKQHYIFPFDPEYVHSMDQPDWDAHLDIARIAGLMTEEEVLAYKKGDKTKKPVRDIAKNGNFAAVYGAGVKKLARTMGISLSTAKAFYEAYHKRNWAVKKIASVTVHKTIMSNGKEELWLLNPVNHFWYSLRNEKDKFSTLNQGTADYVFNVYLGSVLDGIKECNSEKWFTLIGQFHDEFIFQIPDDPFCRQRMIEITDKAITNLNDFLQLNKEMGKSLDFGHRYSQIH